MCFRIASEKTFRIASDFGVVRFESHRTSRLHRAIWATKAGTFRKKFGKVPERPRKRSESISWNSPRKYGWAGIPQALSFKAFEGSRAFPESPPPIRLGGGFFFQKWFRRGPLRAGHGIPRSTGGISEKGLPKGPFRTKSAIALKIGRALKALS